MSISVPVPSSVPDDAPASGSHWTRRFWGLALGSIGVVYGDIGTSPLYAFKESLKAAAAGGAVTPDMVLGVLSLILWALIVIVTLKYVVLMLRADNNGEGGTLTLLALAQGAMGRKAGFVTLLGIVGASLFYGDAIITPAISVLSAVEGLTSRHSRAGDLSRAGEPCHPGAAVRRAEPRHGRRGGLVRTHHAGVVHALAIGGARTCWPGRRC